MGFFDKMKEKVTDVSAKTSEMAKVKMEEMNLKKEISQLQDTIDNYLRLMGASLYESKTKGEDLQDMTEEMSLVKKLYEKQNELSVRLQALTSETKRCSACHAVVGSDALFCNSCGEKLS